MVRRSLVIAFCLFSAPALAQSPYVAGAIAADVSRSSHADQDLFPIPSTDAEVLSGALRVGTAISSIWGVELEFVRSGASHDQGPIAFPLAQIAGLPASISQVLAPIPIDFRPDVRRRHMSVDTVAWVRQPLGGKVDLVYLGGIAFARERSDTTQTVSPVRLGVPPQSFRSTLVEYATRPLVGMEARIGLTGGLRLVPGVRLQGLGSGWLVRPSVGLGWFF